MPSSAVHELRRHNEISRELASIGLDRLATAKSQPTSAENETRPRPPVDGGPSSIRDGGDHFSASNEEGRQKIWDPAVIRWPGGASEKSRF